MNKRFLIHNKAPGRFMAIIAVIILMAVAFIGYAVIRMHPESASIPGTDVPVPSTGSARRPSLNDENTQAENPFDESPGVRPVDKQPATDQSGDNQSFNDNPSTPNETSRQDQPADGADDQTNVDTRPAKALLNLTTSVQETNYWCAPASMQMALRYKGIDVSQADLASQVDAKPATGTEYVDMQRVLNRYLFGSDTVGPSDPGYHIQTLSRYDTDPQIAADFSRRLLTDIATDDPLFAAVDVHTLYPTLPEANHMVVVTGYLLRDGSNDIDSVYFMDPSYMVQDATYGGLKIAPFDEFIAAIVNNEEPAYLY